MSTLKWIAFLILFASTTSASFAQSVSSLNSEVERLKRDLNDLQKHVYKNRTSSGSQSSSSTSRASSLAEIESLEEKIRDLNGKLEELEHNITVSSEKIDRAISDFDQRLNAIEHKAPLANEHSQKEKQDSPSSNAPIALHPSAKNTTPSASYDTAFLHLRNKEYGKAEDAFKNFIADYPDNSLASNATYWLGETFYVRENYGQAAVHFLQTYQKYPDSQKAPDALIKLAASMKQLNKTSEACTTLKKAQKEYSDIPEATKTRVTEMLKELSCS